MKDSVKSKKVFSCALVTVFALVMAMGSAIAAFAGNFKRIAIVVALGIALFSLGACASPSSQGQKEPFTPAMPTLDKSGLYGSGESIAVGGIVLNGKEQSTGVEISLGFPSITGSASLPDKVSVSDFRGGSFDESSSHALKDQIGFAPDLEGKLPEGNSYVVVRQTIENTTAETVSYDVSKGRFVLVNDSGEISDVGTYGPLWRSAWDASNPKQYWIIALDAGATLAIELLYALPNDAINADGLAYLVEPGNANGEEGFVGLKAFDVAGQVKG
ncbi:hypothetical protein [Gordonibacter sp.]|uniref:hypothetical protein n=1 Tax=Gordonibacter sp. TaxID=1968902 RepID=UPI002FCBA35D